MKRLLCFLLLMALGLLALRLSIGEDNALPAAAADKEPLIGPPTPSAGQPGPVGLELQQGKISASMTQRGPFEIPRYRSITEADGSQRRELVYVMTAADSQPVADGLQQLDRLRIELCERGVRTAVVEAKQAFVTMADDANGRPAPDEGKDIDLREAVFFTLPDSKRAGLRLELGDARVKVEDDEVLLTTLPDQPVLLTFEGEQRATLRGLGTQARLPRGRGGVLRRTDVEILSQPVFEADGVTVRAKGRLHYREDSDSGAARVTLDDDVQVDLLRSDLKLPGLTSGRRGSTGTATVRGDQFNGWLIRSSRPSDDSGSARQQVSWRQLELTGAPASVEIDGGRLLTPRMTARPGLFGELMVLTVHGGASRLEQSAIRPGSKQKFPVTLQAQRRLHVIRPGEGPAAMHRAFGFPRWTLRPLTEMQVVVGDGQAQVHGGANRLEASDGIRVLRRDGSDRVKLWGLGKVHYERADDSGLLSADSSDGITLIESGDGERTEQGPPVPGSPDHVETSWRVELGPPGPGHLGHDEARWQAHRYDVRKGGNHLQGHGTCRIDHSPRIDASPDGPSPKRSDRSELFLLDPTAQLTATLSSSELELRGVHRLVATVENDQVQSLDVAGWPLEVSQTNGDQSLYASAPRLLQTGPGSLQLLPVPADAPPGAWRALSGDEARPYLRYEGRGKDASGLQRGELRGPRIDLHHLGGSNAMVDARAVGDERPVLHGTLPQRAKSGVRAGKESPPMLLACEADRIRLLPFVVTPEARWLHGGSLDVLGQTSGHTIGKPWLMVDRVRRFTLDGADEGHVEGTAHRLLVAHGAGAALFLGDAERGLPAVVVHTDRGREVKMTGARVRLRNEFEAGPKPGPAGDPEKVVHLFALGTFDDRSAFILPTLVLREPGKNGLLSHMQALCRGNIEVRPEVVLFGGHVVVQSLAADGTPDPNGLNIDAGELEMARSNGDISRVTGREVTLNWPRVNARTAELELDLVRHHLTARDPKWARVVLADGLEFQSPFIEVDYETMAVKTHRGRGRQRASAQDSKQ